MFFAAFDFGFSTIALAIIYLPNQGNRRKMGVEAMTMRGFRVGLSSYPDSPQKNGSGG
jgi:hypothetical protein